MEIWRRLAGRAVMERAREIALPCPFHDRAPAWSACPRRRGRRPVPAVSALADLGVFFTDGRLLRTLEKPDKGTDDARRVYLGDAKGEEPHTKRRHRSRPSARAANGMAYPPRRRDRIGASDESPSRTPQRRSARATERARRAPARRTRPVRESCASIPLEAPDLAGGPALSRSRAKPPAKRGAPRQSHGRGARRQRESTAPRVQESRPGVEQRKTTRRSDASRRAGCRDPENTRPAARCTQRARAVGEVLGQSAIRARSTPPR